MIAAMPGDAYVENVLKLAKIAVVVSLVAFIANILTAVFALDARSGRPSEQHGSQVRIHASRKSLKGIRQSTTSNFKPDEFLVTRRLFLAS